MPASYSKVFLSNSTNGSNIPVTGSGTSFLTTIHQTPTNVSLINTVIDEIYLYACNNTTASSTLSLYWGNTGSADITNFTLYPQSGRILIADGKLLTNGLSVSASIDTGSIIIDGFANRINQSGSTNAGNGVQDWVNRVLLWSGSTPSLNTQQAFSTFMDGLESSGLMTKMGTVNFFAPDSLTASMVPLLRGTGYDKWNSVNFTSSDLSVNGLKGDGSTRVIDTGIQARSAFGPGTGSVGVSYYLPFRSNTVTPQSQNTFELYSAIGGIQIDLISCYGGVTLFDCLQNGATGVQALNPHYRGLYSGMYNGNTLDGTVRQAIYLASPVQGSHTLVSASAPSLSGQYDLPLALFGGSQAINSYNFYSPHRISFFATHLPMTLTEHNTFYGLVQACRVGLGGGYVDSDPVNDWVKRVVYNGGATPSTNTQNALRTFYNGLVSNNLLNKMKVINPVVPDSLTAAITPFINYTGSYDPWINNGFTGSTINGLAGNGINYLDTGFVPAYSYATASDGGMTIYVYRNNGNIAECEFGTIQGGNSMALYANYSDGKLYFDCYSTTEGSGRNSLSNVGFTGYLSANVGHFLSGGNILRAIYTGSSALGHGTFYSSSTNAGGGLPTNNVFAMELGGFGVPTTKTISFFALHLGLSPTESSNFYTLVQALRTSLGGGFV